MPDSGRVAIKVDDVSKYFILPHEKKNSLKSTALNLFSKKTYEKQKVLNNISFEIKEGEFFGIVGKNGSGKSTLLKLLAKIYTPNEGSVTINGNLTPFIELGVGFNPELSGRENVFLNGALLGFTRKQMADMYDEIVEFAELDKFMDQKLKNYSSGMQVRLAFSIAIRAKSDILLIDEVLAVGDAAFQQKCYSYFEKLKAEKRTIVFVTHDMGAVQRFCSRALLLSKNSSMKIGSPQEMADKYNEQNIDTSSNSAASNKGDKNKDSINLSIKQDDENKKINLKASFVNIENQDIYTGISLLKNGSTIAEINSMNLKTDNKQGAFQYVLDIENLNPGMYEIGAVLFRRGDRKVLGFAHKRPQFIIKGRDDRRGGAVYLEDNWSLSVD